MRERHGGFHFDCSAHCALCRKHLPVAQYDLEYRPPETEAWEYKVLGFCDIDDSNNQPRILTIPANLTAPHTFSELSVTFKSGWSVPVEFCLEPECRRCEGGKIAHLVHVSCWKLMRKDYNASEIYEFARSTHPMFDDEVVPDDEYNMATDLANIVPRIVSDTEMGKELKLFSLLPIEIRFIISKQCTQNCFFSLLRVSEISSTLLDIENRCSDQSVINLKADTIVDTLRAASISVFGQSYISLVWFNNSGRILVERSKIRGIRFALGRYGLRAFSVVYDDNLTSAWLGDPTNAWTGLVYGTDISGLKILQDNLKCIRIDLEHEEHMSETVPRVMWDKELHFAGGQSHYILETVSERRQVQNYPGWRLCKYLPFLDDGGYISGLTMYCNGHGITGMIAHGQSKTLIGQCEGCPIHIYLQPNERIVSVWLRMPAGHVSLENEPNILLATNFNRSCVFGPCLSLRTIQELNYAWTRLGKESGSEIMGIFYDALSIRRCARITNFGISRKLNHERSLLVSNPPRIAVAHHRPRMGEDEITGVYFSKGHINHVIELRVQRVGPRVKGMSIYHDDGSIDVLGQWDHIQSSSIYDRSRGILTSIAFHISGSSRASSVSDIFVGVDHTEPLENLYIGDFKVFSIEKMKQPFITWWFSRHYDHIEPWNGVYKEINVSNRSFNSMNIT